MGQGATPPNSSNKIGNKSDSKDAKQKPPKKSKAQIKAEEEEEEKALLRQKEQADAAAAAAAAQAQTQLLLFQQQYQEGLDDDDEGANFDPAAGPGTGDAGDLEDLEDVSVHSEDFRDEQLLQGLRDLDEEMEAEFNQQIEEMKEKIKNLKLEALKEAQKTPANKEGARDLLMEAKKLEAEMEEKVNQHSKPLSIQIEELQNKMDEMTGTIATKKQESLAALKAGDKPTALEHLKQAKALEPQLEEMKAKMAKLENEKERLFREGSQKK